MSSPPNADQNAAPVAVEQEPAEKQHVPPPLTTFKAIEEPSVTPAAVTPKTAFSLGESRRGSKVEFATSQTIFNDDEFASTVRGRHQSLFGRSNVGGNSGADASKIVPELVKHLTFNVDMFRVRMLHTMDAPLTDDEKALILSGEEKNDGKLQAVARQVQLTQEAMASPDPLNTCKSIIDSLFRYSFEECKLRSDAHKETEAAKLASRVTLNKAIGLQRDKMDSVRDKNKALMEQCVLLRKKVTDLTDEMARKEDVHKQQFNSYLKEVCVLKEQLFRSYRDKGFIAKDVDLFAPIIDDDSGEDITVDQLLHYRRTVRGVERQIATYKDRISSLTEELHQKDTFLARVQEKQRSQEMGQSSLRSEMNQLNDMVNRLETENQQLTEENTDLKMQLATGDFSGGGGGRGASRAASPIRSPARSPAVEHLATPGRRSPVTTPRAMQLGGGAPSVPTSDRGILCDMDAADMEGASFAHILPTELRTSTKFEILKAHELQLVMMEAKNDELEKVRGEFEGKIAALETSVAKLTTETDQAKKDCKDAKQLQYAAETKAKDVVQDAGEQAIALAKELSTTQDAYVKVMGQNSALCQAFLNATERLNAIKTKAGLADYKKRSNDFHFRRAEVVIVESKKRVAQVEKECAEKVQDAELRKEHTETMLSMTTEDLRAQRELHQTEIAVLSRRTDAIQRGFESLLEDFNRLRAEHLRVTNNSSEAQAKLGLASLNDVVNMTNAPPPRHPSATKVRKGSASTSKKRTGSADASKASPARLKLPFEEAAQKMEANFRTLQELLKGATEAKNTAMPVTMVFSNKTIGGKKQSVTPAVPPALNVSMEDEPQLTEDEVNDRVVALATNVWKLLLQYFGGLFNSMGEALKLETSLQHAPSPTANAAGSRPSSTASAAGRGRVGTPTEGDQSKQLLDTITKRSDAELKDVAKVQMAEAVAWDQMKVFINVDQTTRRLVEDLQLLFKDSRVFPAKPIRRGVKPAKEGYVLPRTLSMSGSFCSNDPKSPALQPLNATMEELQKSSKLQGSRRAAGASPTRNPKGLLRREETASKQFDELGIPQNEKPAEGLMRYASGAEAPRRYSEGDHRSLPAAGAHPRWGSGTTSYSALKSFSGLPSTQPNTSAMAVPQPSNNPLEDKATMEEQLRPSQLLPPGSGGPAARPTSFEDHEEVGQHFKELEVSLQARKTPQPQPSTSSSSEPAIPPWKAHKDKMKAAQQQEEAEQEAAAALKRKRATPTPQRASSISMKFRR